MASITFDGVYLAPADDLSNTLYMESAISVQGAYSQRGTFPVYSGGRVRFVTRPGKVNSVQVSQQNTTKAVRDDLEDMVGAPVLYRDGRGRKFYGGVTSIRATEVVGSNLYVNLSFEVSEITHSEEV